MSARFPILAIGAHPTGSGNEDLRANALEDLAGKIEKALVILSGPLRFKVQHLGFFRFYEIDHFEFGRKLSRRVSLEAGCGITTFCG